MKWNNSEPPKDRAIVRFHSLWKCVVSVRWTGNRDLTGKATPWVECTYSNSWPEEAFLPEWAEMPLASNIQQQVQPDAQVRPILSVQTPAEKAFYKGVRRLT